MLKLVVDNGDKKPTPVYMSIIYNGKPYIIIETTRGDFALFINPNPEETLHHDDAAGFYPCIHSAIADII